MKRPLDLVEIGVASAFGAGLSATVDLLADRRSPFCEHEWFRGRDFEPQIVGFADPTTISRFEDRAAALVEQAMADLSNRAGPDALASLGNLVLVLPEAGEGLDAARLEACGADLVARWAGALESRSGARLGVPDVALLGHAGIGAVLHRLTDGEQADTLLLAVDSFDDASRLNAVNDGRKALFSRENRYGFMPGEGAAAAIVRLPRQSSRPLLRIVGAGIAEEPVSEFEALATTFPGLSTAALGACDEARDVLLGAGLPADLPLVENWYSDWNNSRYRAAELAACAQRLRAEFLPDGLEIEHPALRLGDVGAAGALLALALFGERARRTGEVSRALVTSGSWRSGLRAALLAISAPAPPSIDKEAGR